VTLAVELMSATVHERFDTAVGGHIPSVMERFLCPRELLSVGGVGRLRKISPNTLRVSIFTLSGTPRPTPSGPAHLSKGKGADCLESFGENREARKIAGDGELMQTSSLSLEVFVPPMRQTSRSNVAYAQSEPSIIGMRLRNEPSCA